MEFITELLTQFELLYPTQWRFVTSVLAFFLVIGPAIFIHELGHFLVAKYYGVKVFAFSLGFGPKVWSFEYGGTEYCLSAIPLGGYVKMAGEDPTDEHTGAEDEFSSKPIYQRALVILAGPAANLVLGFVLCVGIYSVGLQNPGFLPKVGYIAKESPVGKSLIVGDEIKAVDGQAITSWFEIERIVRASADKEVMFSVMRGDSSIDVSVKPEAIDYPEDMGLFAEMQVAAVDALIGNGTLGLVPWVDPIIGSLKEDQPAIEQGLLEGDRILKINDSPIQQWIEISAKIRASKGDTLFLTIERGGETLAKAIQPATQYGQGPDGTIKSYYAVGILSVSKNQPRDFSYAAVSAVFMTIRMGKIVVVTLKKLITQDLSVKLLAGPVGIAQGSGVSFREGGLEQLAYFLALISVNLGLVNLFPMPLLDGGWLFIFLLYELVKGKPMSQKYQERLMQVGIALLLTLIVVITFNDFGRLLGFQTVNDIMAEQEKTEGTEKKIESPTETKVESGGVESSDK